MSQLLEQSFSSSIKSLGEEGCCLSKRFLPRAAFNKWLPAALSAKRAPAPAYKRPAYRRRARKLRHKAGSPYQAGSGGCQLASLPSGQTLPSGQPLAAGFSTQTKGGMKRTPSNLSLISEGVLRTSNVSDIQCVGHPMCRTSNVSDIQCVGHPRIRDVTARAGAVPLLL